MEKCRVCDLADAGERSRRKERMRMIGIIDYGMGNLGSVNNACRFLDVPARVIKKPDEMEACTGLILPGVGAFGDCMAHLGAHGFVEPLRTWVAADKPLLGICLGMQALFDASEESPGVEGLRILPGMVRRFPTQAGCKIPQIGWNQVETRAKSPLFDATPSGTYFYFVHSYYVENAGRDFEAGWTRYGLRYTSAVCRGRLMGTQFHPEKSQARGLQLLRNFARRLDNETSVSGHENFTGN